MESGRRLKQGEKEGTNNNNNGGEESKSNGGRQSKGKTWNRSKASKCVSAQNNSWGRREKTEVRTGRGSAGLVRGGDERRRADETNRKVKGKGNGGKGEHEGRRRKRF